MTTDGFEKFWNAWPKNQIGGYSRKGGKSECLKKWAKNHNETQADTIVKHVEWLKTTIDWLKDNGMFIPAPLVYLNQQRWDGADIPQVEKPPTLKIVPFDPARAKTSYLARQMRADIDRIKKQG